MNDEHMARHAPPIQTAEYHWFFLGLQFGNLSHSLHHRLDDLMAQLQDVQAKLNAVRTKLGEVETVVKDDQKTDAATVAGMKDKEAASEVEKTDLKATVVTLTDQVAQLTQQLETLGGQGVSPAVIDALMETAGAIADQLDALATEVTPA